LRWSGFRKIHVPLPSLEEQIAIAEVLATADREVHLLMQKLCQLRAEKSALMRQLLAGKRRFQAPAA